MLTNEEYSEYIRESVKRMKPIYEPFKENVKVVRCRDCANSFRITDQDGEKLLLCTVMCRRGLKESDFCSYGKKASY